MNVADGLAHWAARTPYQVAVLEDGGTTSFRALDEAVWHAIQYFREGGIRPGTVTGIGGDRSGTLQLVASFALARMGAIQVPLSPSDPPLRHKEIIERTGVQAFVGQRSAGRTDSAASLALDPSWLNPRRPPASRSGTTIDGDSIWMINHSSGTTGRPKAMAISHAIEAARIARQPPEFASRPGERFMSLTSFDFWVGLSRAMRCLSDGGTVVVAPRLLTLTNTLEAIERHNVTHLSCTPKNLFDMLSGLKGAAVRLPGVRVMRVSTAALPPTVLAKARTQISPNIYTNYGTNEAGGFAVATPDMLEQAPQSVGKLLPGVELELVDDQGKPVPTGETGFVRVRAEGMIAGYVGDSEATAKAFRDGWFYAGDMAAFDDAGFLYLKGRTDEMMNYDGMLVSPLEIERVLLEHPAVADAAAIALPSDRHQDIPAAAVVLRQQIDFAALNAHCASRLGIRTPPVLLMFDELPRNRIGKVLKNELVAKAQAILAKRRENS